MRDAAPEDGLARIVLVEMHRVHVAGGLAEQLYVALRHGALGTGRHAGLEFVEIHAGHGATIEEYGWPCPPTPRSARTNHRDGRQYRGRSPRHEPRPR